MNIKVKFLCALLMILPSFVANAITVNYSDCSADYHNSINAIGRLELRDDKAVLVFKDSNAGKYTLGEIKRISNGESDLTSSLFFENKIIVDAHPSSDKIRISGVTDGEIIRLFTSKGKLVYSGDDTEMNLALYPSGLYILQVGRQVVKIVKN